MTTTLGYISQRNEDGTSWMFGVGMWGSYRMRKAFPFDTFKEVQGTVAESRKNDCPDNGFFGIYNLTFHPCTPEEADAQDRAAIQAELDDLAETGLFDEFIEDEE